MQFYWMLKIRQGEPLLSLLNKTNTSYLNLSQWKCMFNILVHENLIFHSHLFSSQFLTRLDTLKLGEEISMNQDKLYIVRIEPIVLDIITSYINIFPIP